LTLRRLLIKIEFLLGCLMKIAIGITPALIWLINPSIHTVSYLYHASLQILHQFILRDQLKISLLSITSKVLEGDHTLQLLLTWNIITLQCKIKIFRFLSVQHFAYRVYIYTKRWNDAYSDMLLTLNIPLKREIFKNVSSVQDCPWFH